MISITIISISLQANVGLDYDDASKNTVNRLVSSINISFQEVYGISIKDCIKTICIK